METKQYTTIDRVVEGWPSGEWDEEPDKVQWPDDNTGLPCLAVRHPESGHWCGYVGISEGHPCFGKDYSDVDADVHGGLTFANMCSPGDTEDRGVCHVPGAGEPDHVWWLGFDCHHLGDFSPRDEMYAQTKGGIWDRGYDETYKTLAYVKTQCKSLARQLAEAGKEDAS